MDFFSCGGSEYYDLVADKDYPAVYNNTRYPIVVFLERGVLYSKQVLYPGEAVSMTMKQTGGIGGLVPKNIGGYKVHAVIGDRRALPTQRDSLKNVALTSIVPAAFVAGMLMTTSSGGTMAAPSAGLTRLASGAVIKKAVINKAAIAAGTYAAGRAKEMSESMKSQENEQLACVTPNLKPGRKYYFCVSGGLSEGPVVIADVGRRRYKKFNISATKAPLVSGKEQEKRKMMMTGAAVTPTAPMEPMKSQQATVIPTAPMEPMTSSAAGYNVNNKNKQGPPKPMIAQEKEKNTQWSWLGRKKSINKVAAVPTAQTLQATVY